MNSSEEAFPLREAADLEAAVGDLEPPAGDLEAPAGDLEARANPVNDALAEEINDHTVIFENARDTLRLRKDVCKFLLKILTLFAFRWSKFLILPFQF